MYQTDTLFKNLTISKKCLAMHKPYSVSAYHCNGQNYTNVCRRFSNQTAVMYDRSTQQRLKCGTCTNALMSKPIPILYLYIQCTFTAQNITPLSTLWRIVESQREFPDLLTNCLTTVSIHTYII